MAYNFELYFDHLIVWDSLGTSRIEACGFRKHSRTVERNDGSRSEFYFLQQAYIELTGAIAGGDRDMGDSHWTRNGAFNAAHALGFAVSDPEAIRRALYQAGFSPHETEASALADGEEPSWSFVFVPGSKTLGPPLYFVKYLRDISEIYSAGLGPNGISGVSQIEIGVDDPERACRAWEQFLSSFTETERQGTCLALGWPMLQKLCFVVADRTNINCDEACAYGLRAVDFSVDDPAAASKHFKTVGVAIHRDSDRAFRFEPSFLSGLKTRVVTQSSKQQLQHIEE
ncbi:VOC family protein [Rhizobium rhizogenes]|uniref:VOC family protein n=1 Tax=Rhizobium rhizogenes TaxID=359 RepID=UPI00115F3786|nr:VOC family protein [Rhizobium rhizogenes]QCL10413.1 glyoxalase-like domain protein [Rhizobium rhizogenes]TRB17072.1 hypothetical protein EXN70_31680 [Rhizobium rhizogenes]